MNHRCWWVDLMEKPPRRDVSWIIGFFIKENVATHRFWIFLAKLSEPCWKNLVGAQLFDTSYKLSKAVAIPTHLGFFHLTCYIQVNPAFTMVVESTMKAFEEITVVFGRSVLRSIHATTVLAHVLQLRFRFPGIFGQHEMVRSSYHLKPHCILEGILFLP